MLNRLGQKTAIAALLSAGSYPQAALASGYTTEDFLKLEYPAQRSYIDANIGMASLIASQNNRTQGKCIDDWYYGDVDSTTRIILNIMRRLPDYHPRAVILAAIEKECGKIALK